MRKPNYPIMVAVPAFMLVASPLCAVAQRGPGLQGSQLVPERAIPRARPQQSARLPHSPLRTHTFGGHAYHGRLAWRQGRWHHATRNGRNGWWWDVGGVWHFYPQQIEGPPDYVSDIEVADDGSTEVAADATTVPSPRHPQNPTLFSTIDPEIFRALAIRHSRNALRLGKKPVTASA